MSLISSRITYAPRSDATPEAELSALAAVYRIVLSANERDRLLETSGPDDAEGYKNDRTAREIIPKRS